MRSAYLSLAVAALTTAFVACAHAPELDEDVDDGGTFTGSGGAQASSSSGAGLSSTGDGSGGTSSGSGGKPGTTTGVGGGKDGTTGSATATGTSASGSTSSAASSGSGGGVPAAWSCDPLYYGALDGCDCGCGVMDPDCLSAAASACDYCTDLGSCGLASCPGNIDPNNNATCVAVVCGDGIVGPGEQCDDGNTANNDGCDSLCQFEIPTTWTCSLSYYGAQDGCDCGCGAVDPDCTNNTAAACDYCQDSGSCGNGTCPANINPNDNATCI